MAKKASGQNSLELKEGARIAVIGGGPTGSFFSIFALNMAKMIGKEINITIFEPKDFKKDGPGGCNKCGGIIPRSFSYRPLPLKASIFQIP